MRVVQASGVISNNSKKTPDRSNFRTATPSVKHKTGGPVVLDTAQGRGRAEVASISRRKSVRPRRSPSVAMLAAPPPTQLPGPSFLKSFLPLLGGTLKGRAHKVVTRFMAEEGENFEVRFPMPWTRWAFLHDPEMVETLLVDVNPPKADQFCRGIDAVATGSILTSPWEEWLVQRRTTSPALSQKLVGSWTAIFEEAAEPLFQRLEAAAESQEIIEMDGALVEVFLNIITRITLGKQLQPEQTNALMGGITDALERHAPPLLPLAAKATAILPVGRRYRRAVGRCELDAVASPSGGEACVERRG